MIPSLLGRRRNVNTKSGDLDFAEKCSIFASHRSRPASIAGLLRCFFVADGHSEGVGRPSQAALGKNYKALRKNYKAGSFFYLPDSCSQAALPWHKPVTKLLPKVINVNATMHFSAPDGRFAGGWSGYASPLHGMGRRKRRGVDTFSEMKRNKSCTA